MKSQTDLPPFSSNIAWLEPPFPLHHEQADERKQFTAGQAHCITQSMSEK